MPLLLGTNVTKAPPLALAAFAGLGSPAEIQQQISTLPSCRLRRVTEYIEQNLDKDLPLAELAALVYMSPYHFARLFKGSTGLPPHRFVIRQRIARARAFLATHKLSIAQISRMVGFRSPSHFTVVFRRVTGITPRGYRTGNVREAGKEGEKNFTEIVTVRTYQQPRGRAVSALPSSPAFDEEGQHLEVGVDWSRRLKDPATEGELKSTLCSAIDELPEDYRTAFLLHDVEGLSNPEIAETLHVKPGTVKSRVQRARLFLRRRLADY